MIKIMDNGFDMTEPIRWFMKMVSDNAGIITCRQIDHSAIRFIAHYSKYPIVVVIYCIMGVIVIKAANNHRNEDLVYGIWKDDRWSLGWADDGSWERTLDEAARLVNRGVLQLNMPVAYEYEP